MIGEPRLEDRSEQPYVGIRTQVPIRQLKRTIPKLLGELWPWLQQHDIAPDGPPFIRYHVIDMAALMDVELGIPVASPPGGDDRVRPGTLPGGRYAALVYTGLKDAVSANAALLDCGKHHGLVWDRWSTDNGDAFGARFESFLTDPEDEPDQKKWKTEVAIRLADSPAQT